MRERPSAGSPEGSVERGLLVSKKEKISIEYDIWERDLGWWMGSQSKECMKAMTGKLKKGFIRGEVKNG